MSPKAAIKENLATITARLIGLILKMPLEERRQMLTEVERRQDGQKSLIRRKHPRKDYLIQVDYTVKDHLFKGFAINLSPEGVFIESPKNLPPKFSQKDHVILSFDHPEKKEHLKVSGEIARVDPKGIGIKFDQAIMDWWTV